MTATHKRCACVSCCANRVYGISVGSLTKVWADDLRLRLSAPAWFPNQRVRFDKICLHHGYGPIIVLDFVKKNEICFHNDCVYILTPDARKLVTFKNSLELF